MTDRPLATLFFALAALAACGRNAERPRQDAGASGGAGGTTAVGGSGGQAGKSMGGGAGSDLFGAASVLDGYVIRQPCVLDAGTRVCATHDGGACPTNSDPMLEGARPTDETLTFGGERGIVYEVTLHVQGRVEGKTYRGGRDASSAITSGFATGGVPDNTGSQSSIYALRVSAPPGDYFFNSLAAEASRHKTLAVDYEATVPIEGGATLRFLAADPNCHALKNCGSSEDPSSCVPDGFAELEPKIAAGLALPPAEYSGQFVGFVVRSVAIRR